MYTPLYAAILAFLFVALSFRVILLRRALGVAIGNGRTDELVRAARVHANFSEYVPLTLLLMYFLESGTNIGIGLHILGCALIAGRLIHAYGVSQPDEDFRFRVTGMVITLGTMISAAARLLAGYAG
jgi:uncharacterized membrane protein YecN with MAPEG domain